MSEDKQEPKPLEQLIDLFVYAPVGMIYEYQNVIPTLVRRGKSQVQLARVLGQMAARQGGGGIEGAVGLAMGSAVGGAAGLLARGISEFGSIVGLSDTDKAVPPVYEVVDVAEPSVDKQYPGPLADGVADPNSFPIPDYDQLTAKEIIQILPDLKAAERDQIGRHEAVGQKRKTILAKLARLSEA